MGYALARRLPRLSRIASAARCLFCTIVCVCAKQVRVEQNFPKFICTYIVASLALVACHAPVRMRALHQVGAVSRVVSARALSW